MNNCVIELKNVSKTYKLYDSNKDRLKEIFSIGKKRHYRDFNAVEDVSFNIYRGETVGIVGTNGSGKSTILKMITGVLKPTNGTIAVNGNVSALLELGAGFNMEYTGIENIYMYCTIMGMSKETVDEKLDSILDFAEIGDFIYQPVKTYSSGMFARLAFAVSINVEPDILIIDEALSVGDMYFQEKCFEKMKSMVNSGSTILFVSHSLPAVRNFCDRAIWIQNGKLKMQDTAEAVCNMYKMYLEEKNSNNKVLTVGSEENEENKTKNKIVISEVKINNSIAHTNDPISIYVSLTIKDPQISYGLGIIVYDSKGKIVTLFNTIRDDLKLNGTVVKIELSIKELHLLEGRYYISVNVCDNMAMYPYDKKDYCASFEIRSVTNKKGIPIADGMYYQKHEWVFDSERKD